MGILKWESKRVIDQALKQCEIRMSTACLVVVRNVKTRLNVRTGAPSRPGQSPHKVSGRLYDSIFFKIEKHDTEIVGIIYSNDKKARRLELGFVGRDSAGRVYDQKPRPFMRPAFAESKAQIKKIIGAK